MNTPSFLAKLEKNWEVRILSLANITEMESFLGLFNDFFQLCEGVDGSALALLSDCPPSKVRNNDKFVLGLYDKTQLIGLLDFIRNYPVENTWTIGYFLMHPQYQNQGLGARFLNDLEASLKFVTLRCVVQQQNTRALAFWEANGFVIVSERVEKLEALTNLTFILEKSSATL